jgi:hypothetical protein
MIRLVRQGRLLSTLQSFTAPTSSEADGPEPPFNRIPELSDSSVTLEDGLTVKDVRPAARA